MTEEVERVGGVQRSRLKREKKEERRDKRKK